MIPVSGIAGSNFVSGVVDGGLARRLSLLVLNTESIAKYRSHLVGFK